MRRSRDIITVCLEESEKRMVDTFECKEEENTEKVVLFGEHLIVCRVFQYFIDNVREGSAQRVLEAGN